VAEEGFDRTAYYSSIPSPLGLLWAAVTDRGARQLDLDLTEAGFRGELKSRNLRPEPAPDRLEALAREFEEYFAGERRSFDTPPDLSGTGEFQRRVLLTLNETAYGEVVSYGELAYRAGYPRAARAAGNVVATNPLSILIPCHRVIKSDGTPGSYAVRSLPPAEGVRRKLFLLALEGVKL
jgi:methylated-DNA-[protein]-cysteine S-methyltransferase